MHEVLVPGELPSLALLAHLFLRRDGSVGACPGRLCATLRDLVADSGQDMSARVGVIPGLFYSSFWFHGWFFNNKPIISGSFELGAGKDWESRLDGLVVFSTVEGISCCLTGRGGDEGFLACLLPSDGRGLDFASLAVYVYPHSRPYLPLLCLARGASWKNERGVRLLVGEGHETGAQHMLRKDSPL